MTDGVSEGVTYQSTLSGDVQTQVGHWRHDRCAVYIGRSRGGEGHMLNTPVGERGWLGNPFLVEDHGREGCIERFREAFKARLNEDPVFPSAVRELHGEVLGCWCQRLAADGPACHGEVIAEWVDRLNGINRQSESGEDATQ